MLKLTINGEEHNLNVQEDIPLLWALRDLTGLKGTKYGCGVGACGACTVHLDGTAVRSCSIRAVDAAGSEIRTIEGLNNDIGRALKAAWLDVDVSQCGYCQTGQIMQAAEILDEDLTASDDDVVARMNGNLCRCGTYPRIRAAIKRAQETLTARNGR